MIFKMPNNSTFNFCVSVSPEVLGFLTAIGLFIILMTLLFWYLNNKLALGNAGSLQCLDDFRKNTELQGKDAFLKMCGSMLLDVHVIVCVTRSMDLLLIKYT